MMRKSEDVVKPGAVAATRKLGPSREWLAKYAARNRTDQELSFGADVEDAGAKRHRDGESGENQRCGANESAGTKRIPGAERAVPERAEGLKGIVTGKLQPGCDCPRQHARETAHHARHPHEQKERADNKTGSGDCAGAV